MLSVSIIGIGRVGGSLALSLPPETYQLENLIVRDAAASDQIKSVAVAAMDEIDTIGSDVVFITTQDAEIVAASKWLAGRQSKPGIVYHTSGALSSSVLSELKNLGNAIGSIHPLVSISSPEMGPSRFRDAYFCVEGDERAVDVGRQVVDGLGGKAFSIDTKFKTLYHAAAVTACGHLVALFDASVEMMTKCGLSAEDAKDILMPLVTSTVRNLNEQSISAALTGTFARADIETFTRHLTALNENVSEDLLEIYLLLGERSLELAARQGVDKNRIETLRTKVLIAKSKLKW